MISIVTLIEASLAEIGAIAWGETADGTDAKIAASLLNPIIATLNTEQLLPFSRKIVKHTVTTPSRLITIGQVPSPGTPADIVAQRPAALNALFWGSNATSAPIPVVQADIPSLIERSSATTNAGVPSFFAYNPTYPAAELHFDISVQGGSTLTLVYNAELEQVGPNSTPNWPPEFFNLLKYALAQKLASLRQCPSDTLANVQYLYTVEYEATKANNSRSQLALLGMPYGAHRRDSLLTGW